MPGGPPRFFADESVMGLGRVLALARRDVLHPGHRDLPEIPPGTLDPDWMPVVAARGLVVFDRDRHIRTRPVERDAFRTQGLRVFWLAGKRDLSTWDSLRLLVQHWCCRPRCLHMKRHRSLHTSRPRSLHTAAHD